MVCFQDLIRREIWNAVCLKSLIFGFGVYSEIEQHNIAINEKTLFLITNDCFLFGPRHKKPCLRGFANNKGADQPAHLRELFSAFVVCLLESIISRLAMSEILIF